MSTDNVINLQSRSVRLRKERDEPETFRPLGSFIRCHKQWVDIPPHRGRLEPIPGCRCESCLVTSATRSAVKPTYPGGVDDMEL